MSEPTSPELVKQAANVPSLLQDIEQHAGIPLTDIWQVIADDLEQPWGTVKTRLWRWRQLGTPKSKPDAFARFNELCDVVRIARRHDWLPASDLSAGTRELLSYLDSEQGRLDNVILKKYKVRRQKAVGEFVKASFEDMRALHETEVLRGRVKRTKGRLQKEFIKKLGDPQREGDLFQKTFPDLLVSLNNEFCGAIKEKYPNSASRPLALSSVEILEYAKMAMAPFLDLAKEFAEQDARDQEKAKEAEAYARGLAGEEALQAVPPVEGDLKSLGKPDRRRRPIVMNPDAEEPDQEEPEEE